MPTAKEPEKPQSLPAKLAAIADIIGDKEPVRHSRDIKFPYHSARDVYGWWRRYLHAQGIIIVPRINSIDVQQVTLPRSGGGSRTTFLTTIDAAFTVIDGITGETLEGSAVGQGEDPSDKGAGKAMTYAEKAFLLGLGMNGAESDVEAYPDVEERQVRVEESNVTGIQRGGRSTNATDIQVQRFRQLSRDLGLGAIGAAGIVSEVLEEEIELPEDPDDVGPFLIHFLGELSADRMGTIISYMEAQRGEA